MILLGLCLVSGVRLFVYRMTLWIPCLLGSVSGVGYHLYKDLFGMKEVDLVPHIV